MRNAQSIRVGKMGLMVAVALSSLLWGVGCVSYTNVPVPSSAPAFKHANSGGAIKSIVASLDRVILKHPMVDGSGGYAVNLPAGTTPETARTIVSRLPDGAMVPFEGMGDDVPVYHISRIWLRGVRGKVDVVYPFVDQRGVKVDGGVTVWVHGGDRSWYVERMQYWAPGTVPAPPVYVPVGRDGAVNTEVMDEDDFETPMTESELDAEIDLEGEMIDEPGVVEDSTPVDDGALYRQVDN